VYVAPELVHDPEDVKVTAKPELALAATVKLLPFAALDGALVVKVIF
jgi:hypothetical protein